MSFLDNLNKEQHSAAATIKGPVLVLAGAGSGKTRALTYRISHMIKENNIDPYNILALTFTNKASKEMKERVHNIIGGDVKDLIISTFHSFGARFLRSYAHLFNLDKSFNIYDTDDQKKLINQILKDSKLTINLTPSKLVSKISKLKEQFIFPENLDSKSALEDAFIQLYSGYQKSLKENNAIDFADILVYTKKMLEVPEVLNIFHERFHYILVDEYQDTNSVQYGIVKKLAAKRENIFVVGDEDQSIYGFRGADISNILNFEKDYPNATVHKLERNYRSTGNILEAANSVIKNNKTSKGKVLWTEEESGDPIFVHKSEDGKLEARYVAGKVLDFRRAGRDYKDITVLYRSNAQSRELEEEFLREGLPYKIYGGMQFYQRKEIKDIIAFLNLVNNPRDSISFIRVVNVPARGIGQVTLDKLNKIKNEKELPSLLDAIGFAEGIISPSTLATLEGFRDKIASFVEYAEDKDAATVMKKVIDETGYMKMLSTAGEKEREENIKELLASVKELTQSVGGLSLGDYLEQVSLSSSVDGISDLDNHVKMMTVHNSKGLEFPIVFVVGMEEELFPHANSLFSEGDVEEERRLFYVAMTRARENLVLTYAKNRITYSSSSYLRERSRFLAEIPKELLKEDELANTRKKDSEALFQAMEDMKKRKEAAKTAADVQTKEQVAKVQKIVGFSLGERVSHSSFGEGKVKSLDLDKVIVSFDNIGEKKFVSSTVSKFIVKV